MSNVSSGCSAFFACCLINHHTIHHRRESQPGTVTRAPNYRAPQNELFLVFCLWFPRVQVILGKWSCVCVCHHTLAMRVPATLGVSSPLPTGVNPILALRRQRQPTALCCRTPALHAPIRHECNASFCCIFPADSDKSCHWSGGGRPSYKFYPLFATLLTLARNQSSNGQRRDLSL